jgi:hypothetical protein
MLNRPVVKSSVKDGGVDVVITGVEPIPVLFPSIVLKWRTVCVRETGTTDP